jgi:hypothetical protein
MATPAKTVRFAAIVKKAGPPVSYLLWSEPDKDPKFKRALKEHQVMTIHREVRGPHKDHGEVGYLPDRHAQFLVFPKSLRRFEEKRIVGIDYDLLAGEMSGGTPALVAKRARPPAVTKSAERKPKPASEPPPENVFHFPVAEKPPERKLEKALAKALPDPPPRMKMPKIKPAAPLPPEIVGQIRQAVRELKGGKYVDAYTRLNALLAPRG